MSGNNLIQSRYQAPGFQVFSTQLEPEIHFARVDDFLIQGGQCAATFPHINAGDALGRISATGKYRRYTRCYLNAAALINATTFAVKDGLNGNLVEPPFKVGESIVVGTSAAVTITAVDNVNCTITVAVGVSAAQLLGALVQLNVLDGSEVFVGIAHRPLSAALFDPNLLNANFTLDVDYTVDIILRGALVLSKLRGVDAQALTVANGVNKSPAFDCVYF